MEIRYVQEKEEGEQNTIDPLGQSYLPGYFCPAALFDSRETTQKEGGAETTQRDYCSFDQTDESQQKGSTDKKNLKKHSLFLLHYH